MTRPRAVEQALPRLLLLLSVTTGLVDAATVLGLGHVFTASVTGSLVFAGFAVTGMRGYAFFPQFLALMAFAGGALVAGCYGRRRSARALCCWLYTAAMIEALVLWTAAGLAIGFDVSEQEPAWRLHTIVALCAFAMGFRNGAVRQLKMADLTTTVMTLTITGLAADSTLAGGTNPNWPRRVGSIAAIFNGAAVGAVLMRSAGLPATLGVAGATILCGTLCSVRR